MFASWAQGLSFFGFWAYRVDYTCDLTFGKEHAISAGPKQLCTTRCNSFYRHAIFFNMLFSQLWPTRTTGPGISLLP